MTASERYQMRYMNTNQLRDMAAELGADKKKLYGTSKDTIKNVVYDLLKNGENSRYYSK